MNVSNRVLIIILVAFSCVIITGCLILWFGYRPSNYAGAAGEGLSEVSWPPSIASISSGAFPDAECNVGDIHLDIDETDDSVCPTDNDNSFCICIAENTWVALENRKPTYGEMLQNSDPSSCNPVTIGAQDIFVMVDGFSSGDISNMSFSSDVLTINPRKSGTYYARGDFSFEGAINSIYEFCLSVNGVENMDCCSNRKTANNDVGSVGFGCIVSLLDGDDVGVEVTDHDGTTRDPSICDGQVSLFRLRQ